MAWLPLVGLKLELRVVFCRLYLWLKGRRLPFGVEDRKRPRVYVQIERIPWVFVTGFSWLIMLLACRFVSILAIFEYFSIFLRVG